MIKAIGQETLNQFWYIDSPEDYEAKKEELRQYEIPGYSGIYYAHFGPIMFYQLSPDYIRYGFASSTTEQGMRDTIEWNKEQGWQTLSKGWAGWPLVALAGVGLLILTKRKR